MKKFILFILFITASLSFANIESHFKKFKVGKAGQWEAETTILEGPQKGKKLNQKNCVNEESQKMGAQAMVTGSQAMPNCETKVTSDTAESGESLQVCRFGPVTTSTTMKLKRLTETSYEFESESKQNGTISSKTKTISKYVGPCSAEDLADQKKKASEGCQKCLDGMKANKSKCENSKNPQEKQMCKAMLGQIESMCKMSCSH